MVKEAGETTKEIVKIVNELARIEKNEEEILNNIINMFNKNKSINM